MANTSMMVHNVQSIRASAVQHSNANAVSIMIKTCGGVLDITLFDLPTNVADGLSAALRDGPTYFDEQSVRASERALIASRLGLS